VDGMLTCDPRVLPGGYRLKAISYEEAAALAGAGAKVLHPDTVKPAVRQRIPVVIRNSRRPGVEGTRITEIAPPCSNPVKAIAMKRRLTVLELRHKNPGNLGQLAAALREMCERQGLPAEFVSQASDAIFLALRSTASYRDLPFDLDGCLEVRLHPRSAILTLVGAGIAQSPDLPMRALSALKQIPTMLVTDSDLKIAVSLIVPDRALEQCVDLLHREFFSQVDPSVFAASLEAGFQSPQPFTSFVDSTTRDSRPESGRLRLPLTAVSQN